jgi:UPF0176 protein
VELQKIILFYKFTPISDPQAINLWQQTLCENLDLRGRIIISPHGINGTLGGEMSALKKYVRITKSYPGFKQIDFKWSDGSGNEFPRLKIKVRDELVAFGNPGELVVDENGVVGGGIHLRPEEVEELVATRGDEVVFFDGRNSFEAKIGKFHNAIIPDVSNSREFVAEIESGKYDHLKDKPIVTYCTGGIRCEVLSSVMKKRGFKEVYQLKGGIVRYGRKFRDQRLWEGSLYIFDSRMAIDFSTSAKVIGECEKCSAPTKQFHNCATATCHDLILLCESCAALDAHKRCIHRAKSTHPNSFDAI